MAYGAILGQTSSGGKRVCRLVVGTLASGWTSADCDYLCDGTADDVEINAAIQALPSTGGEIVILDGTYNITATIAMNKGNVKLSGNGTATILKRMWDSSVSEGVITVTAANGGCYVENLQVDGNKATYKSINNSGIYLNNSSNNTVTGNTCNNNYYGIYLNTSSNNTVTGNTCNNNYYGIYLSSSNDNTVTGNTCNNNNYGIYLDTSSNNNTVTGNTCNDNNYGSGIYLSNSNDNTVTGNTCNNNNYGISLYTSSNNTVTGNTCNNNNRGSGIYLLNSNDNNTVTGNTCNNNRKGIYLSNSNDNTVTGNTCIRGTGQASDYTSSQYTIQLSETSNNYNLIACNNIMGKNYTSEGGTGNTFVNNKYN